MKSVSQPSVFSPAILVIALLAALAVCEGVTGKKAPLLSSVRVDIVLLVILGMAICSQGGIGRIAAAGTWSRPLAIVGYILGGLILFTMLAVFAGWKLPYIQNEQPSLLAVAFLACVRVLNAFVHCSLVRG